MKYSLKCLYAVALLLVLCAATRATATPWQPYGLPADSVTISGQVTHPLTLSQEHLRRFNAVTGKDLKIVGVKGDIKKTLHSWKGVLLTTLLDSAGIRLAPKERGRCYIVVRGTDNYTTLYSWNDLFNNPTGSHVVLLYEENGQPITTDGPFVMVCTTDKITGPRHVKWVNRIEVASLP
ncbi:molybdopterin-dependent oxidoreductase [Chitinophaga sp. Mgbs1]|uniref:Molybdopterin-dependent oxidoreductase n=1 Tax=Chitinophaga solisilvae TaxID=1233460 RepID=A0A433W8Q7_9BACT|nr:molybdopterin-dependent oxidoreductase [Chitinophaga solisilvae]